MPGYLTAIQKFEADNLLIVDVAHKLVQTESVLQQMIQLRKLYQNKDTVFWDQCNQKFVGTIVLTRFVQRYI
jgi:hypothetical protein